MKEHQISIERIQELFSYDLEAGTITRIKSYGRAIKGQIFDGSHSISVDDVHVRANRLAWALYNGMWPPEGYWVDHKDGTKINIKIVNLRLATPAQNQQNKAGYGMLPKGVTCRFDGSRANPYQARIRVNGARILLGSYPTEEEAAEAYRQAALKYHGDFANA